MNAEINWKAEIEDARLDQEIKAALQVYVEYCEQSELPIIFNLRHLSVLTGLDHILLKKIINSTHSFYYDFSIPKKSGGKRKISAPYPTIAHLQRWISHNILSRFQIHNAATAYIKQRSIIDHVQPHANNYSILVLDLKDFFPSITLMKIKNLFEEIGYPDHISFFLSKICTLKDVLPQGAPSSPPLSNLIGYRIDFKLQEYCTKHRLNYTR
ncbi:MAG: reverse transcriptase domain-containing protein [Cyclobacteriaceae bacterium]